MSRVRKTNDTSSRGGGHSPIAQDRTRLLAAAVRYALLSALAPRTGHGWPSTAEDAADAIVRLAQDDVLYLAGLVANHVRPDDSTMGGTTYWAMINELAAFREGEAGSDGETARQLILDLGRALASQMLRGASASDDLDVTAARAWLVRIEGASGQSSD